MFEIEAPRDRSALLASLDAMHGEIQRAMESLSPQVFVAAQGEFWSPADHMRHLIRSNRPLAVALGAPKIMLRFRFGKSGGPSRAYEQVVEQYHQALKDGAQARGRYLPSPRQGDDDDAGWQALIMGRWQDVGRDLQKLYGKWNDKHLDRLQLPHPVIGNLTVREMLYFTLYHNHHHARRVFERMA